LEQVSRRTGKTASKAAVSKKEEAARNRRPFIIIQTWFALHSLAGRKAPYLEVAYLELLNVDFVMEQNRSLKCAESQTVFRAYILVVINEFATSARTFDGFGKSEHG
jgi:hypothetical protein